MSDQNATNGNTPDTNNVSLPALKARGLALHVAIHDAYAALKATRQTVGERRRTRDILSQLDDIEARLDTVYIEASTQELTVYDLARMIQALGRDYELLSDYAGTAYQDGWDAAFEHVLANAPDDSGAVIAWLLKALVSDTAWQAPEWDAVVGLLRDAQRYLIDHSEG